MRCTQLIGPRPGKNRKAVYGMRNRMPTAAMMGVHYMIDWQELMLTAHESKERQ